MKQQYIDFIEKTVREHCKELQELSMGCRFIWADWIEQVLLFWDYYCTSVDMRNVRNHHFDYWSPRKHTKIEQEKFEILWHPIHLEHILRTMGEPEISIDWKWNIFEWYFDWCETGITFNLSLSWKDQSEETLKFIATVMGFNSNQ